MTEMMTTAPAAEKIGNMVEAHAAMGQYLGAKLQKRNAAEAQKKRLAKIREKAAVLEQEAKDLLVEIDQAEQEHAERMKRVGLALCQFFTEHPELLPAGKAKRGLTGGVWGEFAGFTIGTGKLEMHPDVETVIFQADQHLLDGQVQQAIELLTPFFPKMDQDVEANDDLAQICALATWTPRIDKAHGKTLVRDMPDLVQPAVQVVKTATFVLDGDEIAADLLIPALTAED